MSAALTRALAGVHSAARVVLRTERAAPPAQLYVVVNEVCDLRCRMCGFWQGLYEEPGRRLLETSELRELFDAFARAGTRSLVLTGGEPFLRDDLLELVRLGVERFPFVRLQTNGMHLDDGAVRELVAIAPDVLWVSIDGVGELHDRIRGYEGAFARIEAGLERLAAARAGGGARPALHLNVTVLPENVDALTPIVDLGERVGASRVSFHHVSDLGRDVLERSEVQLGVRDAATLQFSRKRADGGRRPGRPGADFFERVERARRDGRVRVEVDPLLVSGAGERATRGCTWPWGVFMVGPYGDALACQSLDGWKLGDLRERAPLELWNGEGFRRLRRATKEGLPACAQCCVPYRSVLDHLGHREHLERFAATRALRALLAPHPS